MTVLKKTLSTTFFLLFPGYSIYLVLDSGFFEHLELGSEDRP